MKLQICHIAHLKTMETAQIAGETETTTPPDEVVSSLVDFNMGLSTDAEHLSGRIIVENPERYDQENEIIKQRLIKKICTVLGGELS